MKYSVISADNHLIDPKDLYVEQLPKEYRDRAPRVIRSPDGGDGWSLDGKPPGHTFGLEAVAGQKSATGTYKPSGLTWDEVLPGNYDGSAHLKDMDLDNVDAVVLYPGLGAMSFNLEDRAFANAVMQTYNNWLIDDFCGADPSRLLGLVVIPVDDGMEATLAEFERMVAKGAKGVYLPGQPAKPYYDPYYDPLWKAASEAGIPLSFHRNHGGKPKGDVSSAFRMDIPGINVGGIVVRFFTAIEPFTYMIFTGVFERFPTLKVVGAEVNCGWVPFWKDLMDQNYEQQRHWSNLPFDRRPSEYVGRNLFVTTLDDQFGFDCIRRDPSLADAVMFSIDYPHSVTLWPNSARHIEKLTDGFDATTKHKVLAGTAASVYNLTSN